MGKSRDRYGTDTYRSKNRILTIRSKKSNVIVKEKMMKKIREKISSNINDAIILGYFKSFCDNHSSVNGKQRLRNMLRNSTNNTKTIARIFHYEMKIELNEAECNRMGQLVDSFLNKSTYRKKIDDSEKKILLHSQSSCCAICKSVIDIHAHADHIVPFKYVGDELAENIQMLCSCCNKKKNANIDYQIKYLLKLV